MDTNATGSGQLGFYATTTTHTEVKVFPWLTSGGAQSSGAGAEHRYREMVNRPLSRATVIALRERLKAGTAPTRTVRKRD